MDRSTETSGQVARASGAATTVPTRQTSLVIGLGEVGRPLMNVLSRTHPVRGVDIAPEEPPGPVDYLHLCYPGDHPDFAATATAYVRKYQPTLVVIHSTVPVGTCRQVRDRCGVPVVYSPVRGKHARMAEELLTYVKFIGSDDPVAARRVDEYLRAAGMRTKVLATFEAVELAKLTETTYFGLLIAFAQDVDRMAREINVSYDDVASFYEEIGYLPPVRYFPGVIGGHCVMPNIAALKRRFSSQLLDAIVWSNEQRKADDHA